MTAKITFAVEQITPALAQQYLQDNYGNRKISKLTVADYAGAIRRDEWLLNGEAIKFDSEGKLLDGQHRLLAIIQAAKSVVSCVIRGLSRDAFGTIDGGRRRTPADFLYILNYKNPHALARAGRMLFAYEKKRWALQNIGKHKASNDELLATINQHPGLVETSEDYMRRPLFTPLIPHSTGIFVYYLASCVSKRRSRQFFVELAGGEFKSKSKNYAPKVLRDRLQQTQAEIIKPSSNTKLVWTITAWNHFMNDRSLDRLSRIVEQIPRLKPDPVKGVSS